MHITPKPHSAPGRTARSGACSVAVVVALAFGATFASAQAPADDFPAAAIGFLNVELPDVERAVAARDREFFAEAMGRMVDFSDRWGFKAQTNPALARFAPCTEAIADYLIVGLCRLTPSGDDCVPQLPSRFDASLKRCRDLAAARR